MGVLGRVGMVAAAAISAVALLPVSGAQARETASVKPSCTYGEINGTGNGASIPNATRPRQKVYPRATIHNAGAGALSGAFYDYEIIAPSNTRSPAPDVWWHVVGGPWHWMALTWYPAVKGGSDAFWDSTNDAQLGYLAGHGAKQLQFSINFPSGARRGLYGGTLLVGAKSCPAQLLGGDISVTTTYRIG